jgi:hypothetical protein
MSLHPVLVPAPSWEVHMEYEFPDADTLGRYLAMLRNVLLDVRARAFQRDPQAAQLLDAVENLPELLTRWSECDTGIILADLRRYEREFGVSADRYSGLLTGPPQE